MSRESPDQKGKIAAAASSIAAGIFLATISPVRIYSLYSQDPHSGLGFVGTAALCLVLVVIGGFFAISGFRKLKSLKSQISGPEYERFRFELARERYNKEITVGGTPKHLCSVETYAAYRRRLKFLFVLMFSVFAVIGAVAALGALS
ncbi:MAG: hypothetical protein LBE81_14370 [Azonexus sp.]|jgi:hypothetical protein|uniref:hypothetical protein n=1 Tax=Azonexus sp. TaxID=1872668 RepID=UPI00283147B6|nr:hypothetical protein [Azonexus sp.]MDR0777798.1 hypothetical protein [Azonexus sp.]